MTNPKETDAKEQKYIRMTTEHLHPLIIKMAIPTIISMLVTALYNIADTFFVGQVNTNATAGVGLIFPIMTIIQAFGFFFGQGSGNFISRALGAKKTDKAEEMAATGGVSAFLFGLIILAAGLLFTTPILQVLGAKEGAVAEETIQYARDYLVVIVIGAPFMCLSCVLNNQLRFQGNTVFSMVGLVSGAVINCGLDPLFIFGFRMEVLGAALATIISQFISCVILYLGTLKSDSLKLSIRKFRPTLSNYKNISVGGLPSLFRQGLASLATLALNSAAGAAVATENADAAIAAFSVVSKIMMFGFSALLGFGQGFQPVCGFNYGAKKYRRVRMGYLFCLKLGVIVLFLMSVAGLIFAPQLISLFRDDPKVIEYGTIALRWQCSTFTLMGIVATTNMLYQNIGKVFGATILAIARQGLFFIPAVLLLPYLFEDPIIGVYIAQSVADVCAFIIAIFLAVKEHRILKKAEIENA